MRVHKSIGVSGMVAAIAAIGCGPGAVAETIRPNDPTAANALGEEGGGECRDVQKGGEPLVVDWKPDQRGDLEEAMTDGLAVVEYTCKGIRVVKGCKIEGDYGFLGMTRREQMVRLANADEVKANLPFSGGAIGGELGRGSTIEIAMVTVGKRRTTWGDPTKGDLKGKCEGATHFVRSATVGAFAMDTGTEAKVRAAAELFGASVGGASSSAKSTKNKDGDPSDCSKAAPDSAKPPPQCGAPIRLVLEPILAPPKEGAPPPEPPKEEAIKATAEGECPQGMVRAEGKCTTPAAAPAYQCKKDSFEECTAQCDKGHAGSCGTLGSMYASGYKTSRDAAKAAPLFKKACDGGEFASCVALGDVTFHGKGVSADPAAGVKLYQQGCDNGVAVGCRLEGQAILEGKGASADPTRAFGRLRQACEGGDDVGCGMAGNLLVSGKGTDKDVAKAAVLFQRACNGSDAESCNALGMLYETGGPGVPKNAMIAKMTYQRGCWRMNANACANTGRLDIDNTDAAKRSFQNACMRQNPIGCAAMKVVFGESRPFIPPVQQMQDLQRSCNGGAPRDCGILGLYQAAQGIGPMAKQTLDRACMQQDKFACAVAKKVK
jgi:uncharacterized protein